jgi:hypothetical protein
MALWSHQVSVVFWERRYCGVIASDFKALN